MDVILEEAVNNITIHRTIGRDSLTNYPKIGFVRGANDRGDGAHHLSRLELKIEQALIILAPLGLNLYQL